MPGARVQDRAAAVGQRSRRRPAQADTAIFYSISNCQPGLRGISFGNFLIKQVVEELRAELPGLKRFATLSPVPSFKRWLTEQAAHRRRRLACRRARHQLGERRAREPGDQKRAAAAARDLSHGEQRRKGTGRSGGALPSRQRRAAGAHPLGCEFEPARLQESVGMMVNYVYEPKTIEDNHEQFVCGRADRAFT